MREQHARPAAKAEPVGDRRATLRLVELVRPKLIADGMFLVGLDIVSDKLMEVNVFTPGGLGSGQQALPASTSPTVVIDALERKVRCVATTAGPYQRDPGHALTLRVDVVETMDSEDIPRSSATGPRPKPGPPPCRPRAMPWFTWSPWDPGPTRHRTEHKHGPVIARVESMDPEVSSRIATISPCSTEVRGPGGRCAPPGCDRRVHGCGRSWVGSCCVRPAPDLSMRRTASVPERNKGAHARSFAGILRNRCVRWTGGGQSEATETSGTDVQAESCARAARRQGEQPWSDQFHRRAGTGTRRQRRSSESSE